MSALAIPATDATPFSAWSDKVKALAEARVRQLVPVEPDRYNHEEVSGAGAAGPTACPPCQTRSHPRARGLTLAAPPQTRSLVTRICDGVLEDARTVCVVSEPCPVVSLSWIPRRGTPSLAHFAAHLPPTLAHLPPLSQDRKVMVSAMVLQKTGAGLHTHASALWDASLDGCATITADFKAFLVIINVFVVAI